MERLRLLFIVLLALMITSCSALSPKPVAPISVYVSEQDLPQKLTFENNYRQPFSLAITPESQSASDSHLLRISLNGSDHQTIGTLRFEGDSCKTFLNFAFSKKIDGDITFQYFDDALPVAERLSIATLEAEDSNGDLRNFISVNGKKLALPDADRIREVAISLYYPATIVTDNLISTEKN